MHALYYIYMYMYALLKARGRNKQFFLRTADEMFTQSKYKIKNYNGI